MAKLMDFVISAINDPGEVLHQKTMELIKSPPGFDKNGRRLNEGLTYSQALDIVMQENPELAQQYLKSLPGQKARTGPLQAAEKMATLISEKLKADNSLSYSEAFTAVQKDNPELTREYAEEL